MSIEQLENVAKNVASDLGITVEQARALMRVVAKQYLASRGK